jgi:hypothetical protein
MGPSGVGKTETIEAAAEECNFWLLSIMAQKISEDFIHGIPGLTKSEDGSLFFSPVPVEYYAAPIRELRDTGKLIKNGVEYKGIVVFIDELNRASKSILGILFGFIRNQSLPGLDFSDLFKQGKVYFAAAGNPPVNGHMVNKIEEDGAWDRVLPMVCLPYGTAPGWIVWALKNGVDKQVIQFIRQNPDMLHVPRPAGRNPPKVPNPAVWKAVSDWLLANQKAGEAGVKFPEMHHALGGFLGLVAAEALLDHLKLGDGSISGEDVLNLPWGEVLKGLNSLAEEGKTRKISLLAEYLGEELLRGKPSQRKADRIVRFLGLIPRDTQGVFVDHQQLLKTEMSPVDQQKAVLNQGEFTKLFRTSKFKEVWEEMAREVSSIRDS